MKKILAALFILLFIGDYASTQTERTNRTNTRKHDRTTIDTNRQLDRLDSIKLRRDSLRGW